MFSRAFLAATLFFIASTNLTTAYGFAPSNLPVKNFSQVGSTVTLLRGSQPLKAAALLRDHGVDDVLIFKSDSRGEVAKEISMLQESGFTDSEIHHFPMAWKDLDIDNACKQTVEALEILTAKVTEGRTVFFHCTAGEDRTGLLAGLYRLVHEDVDAETMFQEELCAKGYAEGNPGKPRLVIDQIHAGLTPLYFALAKKITAAKSSGRKLGTGLCRGLNPQPVEATCLTTL